MENREFYVKYLDNHAVGLKTHVLITTTGQWVQNIFTVGDLIGAVKEALAPLLNDTSIAELTLHLPEGVAKDSLEQDCFATVDESDTTLRPSLVLSRLNGLGLDDFNPLVIKSKTVTINDFLLNTLADIQKALAKPSTTGTTRNHPKTPNVVGRWESFLTEAASYEYPATPIGADVVLPGTRGIKFKLERDVDKVIGSHLDNLNRIFEDQGKDYRFESKADVFPSTTELQDNPLKFIGVPDNVLTLDSKVFATFSLTLFQIGI